VPPHCSPTVSKDLDGLFVIPVVNHAAEDVGVSARRHKIEKAAGNQGASLAALIGEERVS